MRSIRLSLVAEVLGDVQGVQDQHVVIVLGQGDHITLTRDLQAAAAGHLINQSIK